MTGENQGFLKSQALYNPVMVEGGQRLSARFVLVRALGAGGSGSVWLAQDQERARLVAVKILADALMQDVGAVTALERECERIKALDHPNILAVDGLYRSAQHVWIATEYVAGGDLSRYRGRSASEILRLVAPIASALAYAHGAGIVHRDVKPANVLLTADGVPKLADFGMALAIAELPGARVGLGSPYAMSPQQFAGEAASASDDVYGFGVLLYELLSGYPPFYPAITPERVRDETPPSLTATASIPAPLAQLVDRCLAKSPTDRPADMQTIERELAALQSQLPAISIVNVEGAAARPAVAPPSIRPPVAQGEPLRSEWRRPDVTARNDDELRRQGFRRGLGVAAIVLALVGIGVVFFALPHWVNQRQPASSVASVAAPASAESAPAPKKELDFVALAKARQAAEDRREGIDERFSALRERAVEHWGGAEVQRADAELAAGDKDFAAREYSTAGEHFAAVASLLDVLEKRAGEVLKQQLAAGSKALQEGRSGDARSAFELAVKLEPKNAAATHGLKRAGTLDEVLATVGTAERMEREGDIAGAGDAYRKALALDGEAPRAAAGLARIDARVAGDSFASAMARGFDALAHARYADARNAFESAGKVRPGSPEVAQALKQIEQEERTRTIEAKLAEARALESEEHWADALQNYRAVLALDSTVAFANEGVARTAPRADLDRELELYLTQPERLFSVPVRNGARDALQRAQAVTPAGPVLQKQIATLSEWISRADVPVQVALQSDNLTQVTVYRIGSLGTFAQRSLELVPGNYTVVGTRPGYRDVRREINVTPGATLEPIVIRCEDRI